MAYNVTLIPGDGTGPEIMDATRRAIEATGVEFNWDIQDAGVDVMDKFGTPLPDPVIESIRRNKVAIKGPITTPVGKGFRSVNVALRKALDLYTNLRPCKSYQGVRSRYDDIDLIIVRENTEDLYAGIEFDVNTPEAQELIEVLHKLGGYSVRPDSALAIKIISIFGSRRIVKFAFDYARQNKRKKVSAVHKANIMKFADGLFLHVAEEVAQEYPEIEFNNVIVDNMCMQLVQKPDLYDVLVMPNLYGDILSDLCAGLVGGLGVAPGANIGEDIAVFEPIHGSAPKYARQNKVNPTAAMLSGVMMLRYLNEMEAAVRLEEAVAAVIAEGKNVTYDLKPTRDDPTAVGTAEFGDAVVRRVQISQKSAAPAS
jgi:isocitrate dehydrogenase (NAD+)